MSLKKIFLKSILWLIIFHSFIAYSAVINQKKQETLQNGAQIFMNYCLGCHSLKYLRYQRLKEDLSFEPSAIYLIPQNSNQSILSALPSEDAIRWFGEVPPDLSLIVKKNGSTWLHRYLTGFYFDPRQPFHTNNRVIPQVKMPDILSSVLSSYDKDRQILFLKQLCDFLDYAAEPSQLQRKSMAAPVIVFLLIMTVLVFVLYRLLGRNQYKK